MKLSAFSWLALSFFGYYCAYGVFVPFFPVWLKSHAYSEELIGLVLASVYIFRFIGGMLFSSRIKAVSQLIPNLRLLAWLSMFVALIMSVVSQNFWFIFMATAIFAMINAAGIPLSDTLANVWQQQIQLDYGRARLIGSFAFVVGVVVFGYVIGFVGDENIMWILTALLLLYSLIQMSSPQPTPLAQQSAEETQVSFISLLRNSTTWRLIVVISLIHGSHAAFYAYSVLYWSKQGISVQITSLLWGLAVMAEIVFFFFSKRLFSAWNINRLFVIAAIATTIRWICLGTSSELWLIVLTQLLHSFTYSAGHYAIIRYFTTQPQSHIAKLQGLYTGFAGCIGVAIFTAISGVLYPISASLMFFTMAGFACLALLFIPYQHKMARLRRGQ